MTTPDAPPAQPGPTQPTLRRRLAVWQGALTLVVLTALMATLLWIIHYQIHHQTDLLLLRFAEEHAQAWLLDAEPLRPGAASPGSATGSGDGTGNAGTGETRTTVGDDRHDHHPSMVALVLSHDCAIVSRSGATLDAPDPTQLCAALAAGRRIANVRGVAPAELRMAAASLPGAASPPGTASLPGTSALPRADGSPGAPDTAAWAVVGLDHASVDASTWYAIRVAVALGLLAFLLIVGAGYLIVRRLTSDLEDLSDACARLDVEALGTLRPSDATSVIDGSRREGLTGETAQLARTVGQLVDRVQESFQARERFIVEVAHELRTPLTALIGEIEVTLRKPRGDHEYRETLEQLRGDAMRLVTLTESLLAAARAREEALNAEPVQLLAAVDERLQRLQATISEGARPALVVTVAVAADHVVLADDVALGRVIDNLVVNTVRHAGATTLRVSSAAAGSSVLLVIEDDGRGLPADVEATLFEPFARPVGHDSHGLGLYLCRGLVEQMGGALTWEPVTPTGSRWVISLPAADRA